MDVNISEAKAQLSKLINLAFRGERVVICKNNLPLVELVPHKPSGKRVLGSLKGKVSVPENLMAPDAEIEQLFYNER